MTNTQIGFTKCSNNIFNFDNDRKQIQKILIKEKIASNSFESPQNLLENIENISKMNKKSY